jgi:hypothetical protein
MRAIGTRIKKLENTKKETKERYPLSIAIYGREWLEANIGLDRHNSMSAIEKDAIYDNAWLAALTENFADEIAEYETTLTDIGLSAWRAIFEGDYDAPLLKPFDPNRVMGRLTDMQFDLMMEFMARQDKGAAHNVNKDAPLCGVNNKNK